MQLEEKLRALEDFVERLPGAIVAFSGGADSAFVAEAAHRVLGRRSTAVTADSPSLPRRELKEAQELARARGWNHRVVETYELADGRYSSNPVDRCYWCKSALFDRLQPLSAALGWAVLMGTNLDDLGDWRPGQRASSERGALHPLVEVGMSKAEVRRASAQWGLPTAGKPASACLASRFAYGVPVTLDALARVEAAEEELLRRGFLQVRVRDLGDDRARIEVALNQVGRLESESEPLAAFLHSLGFESVEVDQRGYRQGALNEGVPVSIRGIR